MVALSWPLVNKHSSVLSATLGAMKGQRVTADVQVVLPILLSSRQHCIDLPGFMESCDIGLSRLGNYQVEERTWGRAEGHYIIAKGSDTPNTARSEHKIL